MDEIKKHINKTTIVRRTITIDPKIPQIILFETIEEGLEYYCDNMRHLVCKPYSKENLHRMAEILKINKCFYHPKGRLFHPHYDIPIRRIKEIQDHCYKVSRREILIIIKTTNQTKLTHE